MKQKRIVHKLMPLKLATTTWDQAEYDAYKAHLKEEKRKQNTML